MKTMLIILILTQIFTIAGFIYLAYCLIKLKKRFLKNFQGIGIEFKKVWLITQRTLDTVDTNGTTINRTLEMAKSYNVIFQDMIKKNDKHFFMTRKIGNSIGWDMGFTKDGEDPQWLINFYQDEEESEKD